MAGHPATGAHGEAAATAAASIDIPSHQTPSPQQAQQETAKQIASQQRKRQQRQDRLADSVGPPLPAAPGAPDPAYQYPLPLTTLEAALCVPPGPQQLGALVTHAMAHRDGPVGEVLAELLGVTQELVSRLVWFGAVYYCPVAPLPHPSRAGALGEEALGRIRDTRQAGLRRWGNDSRHQTPRRLASDEEPVTAGGYIRAHCHPKRFPAAYAHLGPTCGQPAQGSPSHAAQSPSMTHGSAADSDEGDAMAMRRYWGPRLLHVAGDHVVVSKPPGLQVPPTVDNVQESLLACVERALSPALPPGTLRPAHRLDAGTEGVVVAARSSAFAAYFRELMADKGKHAVRKRYKCLVANLAQHPDAQPPAHSVAAAKSTGEADPLVSAAAAQPEDGSTDPRLGGCLPLRLVHWVLEDQRAAGEMAHTVVVEEGTPGALRCELVVEQAEVVALSDEAATMWDGITSATELTVNLITGRTHQVRVQMAAVGCPLLGDRLYGALVARGALSRSSSSSSLAAGDINGGKDVGREAPAQQGSGQQEGGPGEQQRVRGEALEWCRPALEQQLAPVALQAHSLEVLEDGPMGRAPVHHCAGPPWWRRTDSRSS